MTWLLGISTRLLGISASGVLLLGTPMIQMTDDGYSNYNALQARLRNAWQAPALTGSAAWMRLPFGGWQSSGIWSWRSGTPFNITSDQDRPFSGVGLDRADLVGNPNIAGDRTRGQIINQYFNTSAFALNAPGTFGNVPRNYITGPSFFNVDFSMQKSFQPLERVRVTLRGDFFNIFNNVYLNAPGASVSSTSTFGKVSSAGDPRILQIALRVHF